MLVCGSRTFNDARVVEERMSRLPMGTTFIVGGARGADSIAEVLARSWEAHVMVIKPDWDTHGKRAGFLRNLQMLDQNPDLVLAFWDGESKGTQHTIREARKRGIPVEITTGIQPLSPEQSA